MHQILIVDDSKTFGALLCRLLEKETGLTCAWAKSYEECAALLTDAQKSCFMAAVLDLNLPDAQHGEVVDLVTGKGIPSIVFTGELSPELRATMWSKHIVDYLYKDKAHSLRYLALLIKRLMRNRGLKTLVVDDSGVARRHTAELLQAHGYDVLTAENGEQALDMLQQHQDTRLIILDYFMPGMNGAALTTAVRERFSQEDTAIIGLSAQNDASASIAFLKSGANDFITKPFQTEEFYCRIAQNVDILNMFKEIREMANRDFLTKLYNRKLLFETGGKLFASRQRGQITLTAAVMDIDFFKKVNDTYGHDGGDAVLKHFASLLQGRFRETDIVARIGGEEFCVLLVNTPQEKAFEIFEEFRLLVEASPVEHAGHTIAVTVSIGISSRSGESLDDMLKAADELLYKAKEGGRNRVLMD